MIKERLRQLVESPRRRLIVIIGTFVVGLVTVLPLADEYSDWSDQTERMEKELAEARRAAANLDGFQLRVDETVAELAKLEARSVSEQRIVEFRGRLVALVRESGCQVRSVKTGIPRSRNWLTADHPIEIVKASKTHKETGYELKSQTFSLSVSGSLPGIKRLLKALDARDDLAHAKSLTLRPVGSDRKEVILEIELLLFDLANKKPVSA